MRVHAIILTRDRPVALRRCVDTALSTLGVDDVLTVLDDSCEMVSNANADLLDETAGRFTAHVNRLVAEQLHEAITEPTAGHRALWQSRTAARDIAPLRNLSLLLSTALDAQTTVLLDDDVCCFDLEATHRALEANLHASGGVVVGAKICGTTEADTITRLSDAMRLLESRSDDTPVQAEELFRVTPNWDSRNAGTCELLSAGYLAFRLPPNGLFAFPPGYNEDWLWCALHGAGGQARLLRVDQVVVHEPPMLRQSTRDDLLFELAGDLVLDCLVARGKEKPRNPESVLKDLVNRAPDPSVMPSVRAQQVVREACCLLDNGHVRGVNELENYGLSVLRAMLRSGELAMDGIRELSAWSDDAAAKHKSFAATLGAATVPCALRSALKEGRK